MSKESEEDEQYQLCKAAVWEAVDHLPNTPMIAFLLLEQGMLRIQDLGCSMDFIDDAVKSWTDRRRAGIPFDYEMKPK
jgi:hypothetical protein